MSSLARNPWCRRILATATMLAGAFAATAQQQSVPPDRQQMIDAMKRATVFMVDKVSTNGGYVWTYLPDLSRRWGELEARATMIWIQPPGTATMGHLFLDAFHVTRDEYYYAAAEKVAGALIWAQHPSGGWNYLADFAGERSLRDWYDTVGKNAWRLEEFQHYWGNATFDDAGTADSAKFLLRLYLEKRDPKFRPALDKAIAFVIDSQYPIGGWPQRYPRPTEQAVHGNADYTSYITFNDDVAAENIEFLTMCYQSLGDARLLDSITRGMNAFLVMQQGPPQAGWALQYTLDLKPAGARTYEPKALVTHTTAANIESLIRFYRLTGETKFLARVPEAIAWLERTQLPAGVAPAGRTHPTFIELDTDKPLYVHRRGSNVVNGAYYVDYESKKTIGHYSAFRRVDLPRLKSLYEEARAIPPEKALATSPLGRGAGIMPLPRLFVVDAQAGGETNGASEAATILRDLKPEGYWLVQLRTNSYPYSADGSKIADSGDYSQAHVGDKSDTSPFPDEKILGISVASYLRNMSVLLRQVDGSATWRVDNLDRIGGHPIRTLGTPRVVQTELGPAVEFNGKTDGLVIDTNPIAGLRAFTIELLFQPDANGPEEQRFLHIEEAGDTGSRALIELRMLPDGSSSSSSSSWALDTFLRNRETGLTLLDRSKGHPAAQWHTAALVYDGRVMQHYVNGERELSGEIEFPAQDGGRTSLGVRQTLASWFKGRIHSVRVSAAALPPAALMRVPHRADAK